MQVKYTLAAATIALLAVPGTASQLAARGLADSPLLPVPVNASTDGAFSDPVASPRLSIELPTRFSFPEVSGADLQRFPG